MRFTYLHSVQQTFERRFKKTLQTRQNLSNAARHTLKWLRQPDCPVCLVSTDKNLQPVVDFKARYIQLVTAELSETHQPAQVFLNNQPAPQEPAFTDDDKRIVKQWLRPHLMFPPSTIEGTASLHGLCYSVSLGVRNSGTACLAISGAEIVFISKYTHHTANQYGPWKTVLSRGGQ